MTSRADWIVIGAGWAGLAAARRLAENRPSDRIAIIDAAAAADGASGRNSGFAIDLPHTIGGSGDENEGALGYMRLARAAIASLKEQIDAHGIDCDWREQGKYQAAVTDRGTAAYLEPFAEALARLGEPFEWVEAPVLREKLGTDHFTRAVYTPGGGLMNPVALVRGLADSLPGNVDLYEHTPAMSVEYANGTRVTTPEGTIRAPQCILAVNGFAPHFGAFERRVLPMMAHASLTRRLTEAEQAAYGVTEDWGMTPANSFVGATMRYTSDQRLLIREKVSYCPGMRVTEAERHAVAARPQAALRRALPDAARRGSRPHLERIRRAHPQLRAGIRAGPQRRARRLLPERNRDHEGHHRRDSRGRSGLRSGQPADRGHGGARQAIPASAGTGSWSRCPGTPRMGVLAVAGRGVNARPRTRGFPPPRSTGVRGAAGW